MLAEQPYLGGAEYSHADIAFVPWVLRARDMLGVDFEAVPGARRLARAARGASRDRGGSRDRRRAVNSVVDAAWLAEHLGDEDLVVGDVRGPNAHMRGHIPGSRPLVLGSPPPGADEATVAALAQEVALRLRRHGITGRERLVLVDRGDGIGAMPALQMAELAGHPNVAVLLGGMAAWEGELAEGAVELEPVREAASSSRTRSAMPTRQEIAWRLGDESLVPPRHPDAGRVHGPPRKPVRSAAGPHPRRASRRASAISSTGRAGRPRRSASARSSACRKAPRSWRTATPARARPSPRSRYAPRLQRAQLPRLLARVEPPRRAPARALADPRLRREDARPREWLSAWSVGRSERLPTSGRRPSVTV